MIPQSLDVMTNWAFQMGLIEIIWEPHAYVEKEERIQRSLRERLLSLPWRPFEKTKIVAIKEPAMFWYQDIINGKKMIVCHPSLKQRLVTGLYLIQADLT